MFIKRKDGGCESKILAVTPNKLLIEARWEQGGKPFRNVVNVSKKYFIEKYGEGHF
jgi:hypothetical protein